MRIAWIMNKIEFRNNLFFPLQYIEEYKETGRHVNV